MVLSPLSVGYEEEKEMLIDLINDGLKLERA
jgi:hypothetical protein